MSLNETVSAMRVHIGFFGLRNVGKSSLVNAVTGQDLSVVSEVKGTTTDPVKKAMELLPLGPVVIIDTPGLDDEGALGEKRVEKAKRILRETDLAVLVTDSGRELLQPEKELIALFRERELPFIIAYNKCDLIVPEGASHMEPGILVSALTGENIKEFKDKLAEFAKGFEKKQRTILYGLVEAGDIVVLVIPIDESAPKGRIILPQQLVLRELLDRNCAAVCCQVGELSGILQSLKRKPRLVITDSQAFEAVGSRVPEDIALTSFSILMARYKGELAALAESAKKLSKLADGDRVLISEGCTHHRQCNDIGTVKLPGWIREYAGAEPVFSFTSGGDFPDGEELKQYDLVVHCGGCMLNEKEMKSRQAAAENAGVPMVNYGIAIAAMKGLLERALEPVK